MFNTAILEVLFGLALTYFFLSLVCSALAEVIASCFNFRGQILSATLEQMLGTEVKGQVYAHPLVRALHHPPLARFFGSSAKPRIPAYIPGRLFALALIDVLTDVFRRIAVPPDETVRQILIKNITARDNYGLTGYVTMAGGTKSGVCRGIIALLDNSVPPGMQVAHEEAVAAAVAEGKNPPAPPDAMPSIGATIAWYNDVMERASGAYKRRLLLVLIVVSTMICTAARIDTQHLAQYLWTDSLRHNTITSAQKRVMDRVVKDAQNQLVKAQNDVARLETEFNIAEKSVASADSAKQKPGQVAALRVSVAVLETKLDEAKAQVTQIIDKEPEKTQAAQNALEDVNAVLQQESPFGPTPTETMLVNANSLWDFIVSFLGSAMKPGMLFTIVAVSLGAPFWFDVLSRVANLRGNGRIPLPDMESSAAYGTSAPAASASARRSTDAASKPVKDTTSNKLPPQY